MIAKHLAVHVAVFAIAVATLILLGAPLPTALLVGMLAGCFVMLLGMGRHGGRHEETGAARAFDLAPIQDERTEPRRQGPRRDRDLSRAGDTLRRPFEVPDDPHPSPRHADPTH